VLKGSAGLVASDSHSIFCRSKERRYQDIRTPIGGQGRQIPPGCHLQAPHHGHPNKIRLNQPNNKHLNRTTTLNGHSLLWSIGKQPSQSVSATPEDPST